LTGETTGISTIVSGFSGEHHARWIQSDRPALNVLQGEIDPGGPALVESHGHPDLQDGIVVALVQDRLDVEAADVILGQGDQFDAA